MTRGGLIWRAERTIREADEEDEKEVGVEKRENNGKVDKADRTVERFDSKKEKIK